MAKHTPRFLQIVNDARDRVRETGVDEVKAMIDKGEPFLLIDVARGERIRQGPSARRGSSRQGDHRARHRDQGSRHRGENGALLRRRVSLGPRGGQSAKDGLHQRHLDGRRHPRLREKQYPLTAG